LKNPVDLTIGEATPGGEFSEIVPDAVSKDSREPSDQSSGRFGKARMQAQPAIRRRGLGRVCLLGRRGSEEMLSGDAARGCSQGAQPALAAQRHETTMIRLDHGLRASPQGARPEEKPRGGDVGKVSVACRTSFQSPTAPALPSTLVAVGANCP
jgi:hypothetical protein